jgi:hypothetical protein
MADLAQRLLNIVNKRLSPQIDKNLAIFVCESAYVPTRPIT